MSFLSGLTGAFNPMTLLGTAMGGPIGAIIAQALQQVVSQVVQEIIQKAGDQLGLPQSFIDIAQGAAAGSLGDTQGATRNLQEAIGGFANATGATGAQNGQVQREASDFANQFIQNQVDKIVQNSANDASSARGGSGTGNNGARPAAAKGGSVLMQIALNIGEAMDKKVDRMADISSQMSELDPKKGGDEFSQYNTLSAEMTALGQELKIVSGALDNALKSLGDAASKLAGRN